MRGLPLSLGALVTVAGCSSEPSTDTPSFAALAAGGSAGAGGGAGGGATGGGAGGAQAGGAAGAGGTFDPGPIGGDRPVQLYVPSTYHPAVPMPLVVLLHGYTASGDLQEFYLQLEPLAEQKGFLYARPDGTSDGAGQKFWNATDACCDLGKTGVDDSGYLRSVVDEIIERYSVDKKRIYFVGHSNGAFMSHRMACDHADIVAAIGTLAGVMWADPTKCAASEPVSVLQIHGTLDLLVSYNGGVMPTAGAYPSAFTSTATWAAIDGCSASPAPPALDMTAMPGFETTVSLWSTGCKPGGHAELWTLNGAGHLPVFNPTFTSAVIDFFFAHPKP